MSTIVCKLCGLVYEELDGKLNLRLDELCDECQESRQELFDSIERAQRVGLLP